jgi:type I restriction enzyme S subunit
MKRIPVPIPPISEQKRIVAKIEELFSELDSGVETLKKTKQQLAVYRQAVLKAAFEGLLTSSGSRIMVRLGDYIDVPRYGTAKKCSLETGYGAIPVYRIPNIEHQNGRISHDDLKYAQFTESELAGIRLKQGDILVIRSNGSASLVGRAAMVSEADTNGTFAGYLMRLRIRVPDKLLPRFVLLFLQSHSARVYIENKAKSTSGVHNINSSEISDIQLPLFDGTTQRAIIEAVESRLAVCDSIEKTVDAVLQQAEAMRQSILKTAFEGNL